MGWIWRRGNYKGWHYRKLRTSYRVQFRGCLHLNINHYYTTYKYHIKTKLASRHCFWIRNTSILLPKLRLYYLGKRTKSHQFLSWCSLIWIYEKSLCWLELFKTIRSTAPQGIQILYPLHSKWRSLTLLIIAHVLPRLPAISDKVNSKFHVPKVQVVQNLRRLSNRYIHYSSTNHLAWVLWSRILRSG